MENNLSLDYLRQVEGRWYLQFTGSPFWQKDQINTVTFNYQLMHVGDVLVLEDKVEYIRNSKMRFRLGYDYPIEEFERTFKWKGKGINRFFRNRFEISILTKEYMVLFFEKTVLSPACIDIVTREKNISQELEEEIFSQIEKNETIKQYLEDVEEAIKL